LFWTIQEEQDKVKKREETVDGTAEGGDGGYGFDSYDDYGSKSRGENEESMSRVPVRMMQLEMLRRERRSQSWCCDSEPAGPCLTVLLTDFALPCGREYSVQRLISWTTG
jgi:hypothetical protein